MLLARAAFIVAVTKLCAWLIVLRAIRSVVDLFRKLTRDQTYRISELFDLDGHEFVWIGVACCVVYRGVVWRRIARHCVAWRDTDIIQLRSYSQISRRGAHTILYGKLVIISSFIVISFLDIAKPSE